VNDGEFLDPRVHPATSAVSGLYLHVPFCASDCAYCVFSREIPASRGDIDDYLSALAREARWWADRIDGRLAPATLYVGGGTPSHLTPEEWDRLEAALSPLVDLRAPGEITIEANPESATPERLERFVRFGMTRLSIGAQALGRETLALLGRTHDFARVREALAEARRHERLVASLDLIYGIPGLDDRAWSRTLDEVLALGPDHLSAYCLGFEEGSSLTKRRDAGHLPVPDDRRQRRAYDQLVERAESAGLGRYEVSNFGTAAGRSRHNLGYWEGASYLGLGPSAHSHVAGLRFRNHTVRRRWQEAIAAGEGPVAGCERLGPREIAAERLMRLRVTTGVPLDLLPAPGGPFWSRVRALEGEGLVVTDVRPGGGKPRRDVPVAGPGGERLRLAHDAFFLCDGIAADLLMAWEEEAGGWSSGTEVVGTVTGEGGG
jgi:oxygen-independent coproporphyrinogen-3 oxidase